MLGFSLPQLHRPGQWDAVLKAETAHCGRASCRVRRMEGRVGVQQLPLEHKQLLAYKLAKPWNTKGQTQLCRFSINHGMSRR